MSKGWYKEPIRHSLASKGVQTVNQKKARADFLEARKLEPNWTDMVYYLESTIDDEKLIADLDKVKDDLKKAIKLFWWSSINNSWKHFHFEMFFRAAKKVIDSWFMSHFHFKDTDLWSDCYQYLDEDYSNWEEVVNEHSDKKVGMVKQLLATHPEKGRKLMNDLSRLKGKLMQWHKLSHNKKVELVDELIHFEHIHNQLFDIDISKLRKDFEEEYL